MVINNTEGRSNEKECPTGYSETLKAYVKLSSNTYCVSCDDCLTLTPSGQE